MRAVPRTLYRGIPHPPQLHVPALHAATEREDDGSSPGHGHGPGHSHDDDDLSLDPDMLPPLGATGNSLPAPDRRRPPPKAQVCPPLVESE